MEDSHLEIPDKVLDLEGMLVTKQSSERHRAKDKFKVLYEKGQLGVAHRVAN